MSVGRIECEITGLADGRPQVVEAKGVLAKLMRRTFKFIHSQ